MKTNTIYGNIMRYQSFTIRSINSISRRVCVCTRRSYYMSDEHIRKLFSTINLSIDVSVCALDEVTDGVRLEPLL